MGSIPYDIMGKYWISHSDVMDCVWHIVEAMNILSEFKIEHPQMPEEQENNADEFKAVIAAGIDVCTDAIDGILIWIAKPEKKSANDAEVSQLRFLCGRDVLIWIELSGCL